VQLQAIAHEPGETDINQVTWARNYIGRNCAAANDRSLKLRSAAAPAHERAPESRGETATGGVDGDLGDTVQQSAVGASLRFIGIGFIAARAELSNSSLEELPECWRL